MLITYENKKVKKQCTNLGEAKKKFPYKVAQRLHKAISFIENATSLKSVIEYRPFRFHDLKGDKNGLYAIDIGSVRDGYRMILKFKEDKEEVFHNSIEIVEVIIKEVGNHYE